MKFLNILLIGFIVIAGNAAQKKPDVKKTEVKKEKKVVQTKIAKKEEFVDTRKEYTGEPKPAEKVLGTPPVETDDRAEHFKYFKEHSK